MPRPSPELAKRNIFEILLSYSRFKIRFTKSQQEEDMKHMHNPTHPGEILQDIWPEDLTLTAAAQQLGVPRSTLANILNGDIGITVHMADKLHNWCGISAERWLRMQIAHDMWTDKSHPHTNEAARLSLRGI